MRATCTFYFRRYETRNITLLRCRQLAVPFLANLNSRSRWLYVIARPSVCLFVVCNVRALLRQLKFSAMFLRHLVRWPSVDIQVKFYGDRPRGTPPLGEVKHIKVDEYSDF